MGEQEIARFLSSLATERHVSASTQNQALNALLFLYHQVLEKKIGLVQGVVRAKKPTRLPVVLTKEEVKCLLVGMNGFVIFRGSANVQSCRSIASSEQVSRPRDRATAR